MNKFSMMLIWMMIAAALLSTDIGGGYAGRNSSQGKGSSFLLNQEIFRYDVAGKIGSHVYYSYNVIEGRNLTDEDEAEVWEYLRRVDEELTEDVFVTGFGKSSITGRWIFNAEQYINGAVVPEVRYRSDIDTAKPSLVLTRGMPLTELDTSWSIDPQALIPDVKAKALAHSHELCNYVADGLHVKYLLAYDVLTDTLQYEFIINETSYIYIDAFTGETLKECYWDGVCID